MKTSIQTVMLRPHSSDTLRPRLAALRHAGSFSRCSGSSCFFWLLLAVCILVVSGGTSAMPATAMEGHETTAEDLAAMLDTGEGAVATLVVEKTQLAVGRAVLSARSQFFAAMFPHDPLEARRQEFIFPDVEGLELRKLVAFTNSGMARQLPVKTPQLLAAATEYGGSGLRDAFEQQLAKPLAMDNVAANAVLEVTHDYPTLRQAAVAFIRDHVFQVKATQGWEEAVHSHPQTIVQLASLLVEPTTVTRTTAAAGSEATPTTRTNSDHGQTSAAATTPSPCPNTPPLDEAYVSSLRNLSDNEKYRRLSKAAERWEVEEVRALLAAGADVGAEDVNGWTALHVAAYNGDVRSVGCLLNAGAEVGARQGTLQTTPLHWAAQIGQTSVVRLLLAASADPDARDTRGRTPLHTAAMYGQAGAATALLEGGADKGARDYWRETPLDLARGKNHQQLMQILESAAATAGREDTPTTWPQSDDGDTPEAATPSSTYPDTSPLDDEAVSHLRTSAAARSEATPTTRLHGDHGRTPAAATMASPCPNTPPLDEAYVSRLRNLSDNEKNSKLAKAAEQGATGEARALLAAGVDVGAGEWYGWTALHIAAYNGQVGVVGCLLQAGADVAARQGWLRTTPLHWAAQMGQTSVVRLLLAASADPDARDTQGMTPLHMAAIYGQAGVATALLEGGADKGLRDDEGETPLDLAREKNHQQLTQILESAAATAGREDTPSTWPQSDDGDTPAADTPSSTYPDSSPLDDEAVSHLRTSAAAGSDATPTTRLHSDHGRTPAAAMTPSPCPNTPPLDEAYVSRLRSLSDNEKNSKLAKAAEQGATGAARALLAAGADVGAGDENGWTALHFAAYNGQVGVVGCLLQAGADVAARQGRLGMTPLQWAAEKGETSVVRLLLAASADPDATDTWGRTPLHMAAMYGQGGAATALLEAGADKGARDDEGDTPLDLAREMNDQQLMQILERTSAAAGSEATPTTRLHSDHGRTPAAAMTPSPCPDTPPLDEAYVSRLRSLSDEEKTRRLSKASEPGAVGDVRALLAAGADVGAGDENGWTALHVAAYNGHVRVVGCLLQAGAEVGARQGMSWATPLHWAAQMGQTSVVRLLLAVSADADARDTWGRTPLHRAAMYGQAGAATALLEAGADKGARDDGEKTPLDLAKEKNHQQLMQILERF